MCGMFYTKNILHHIKLVQDIGCGVFYTGSIFCIKYLRWCIFYEADILHNIKGIFCVVLNYSWVSGVGYFINDQYFTSNI